MDLENCPVHLTQEQFKAVVKEYIKTNDELKKINVIAKNIRTKKAELEKIINGGMKSFSIEEINLRDGSAISYVEKKKSIPLNKKWVEQRLKTMFENPDSAKDIDSMIDYICNPEYRQTEEVVEKIKFVTPKAPKEEKPKTKK